MLISYVTIKMLKVDFRVPIMHLPRISSNLFISIILTIINTIALISNTQYTNTYIATT